MGGYLEWNGMEQKNNQPTEYRLTLEASEATVFEDCDSAARAAAQATCWPQVEAYVKYACLDDWHPQLGSADIQMIWVGYRLVIRVELRIEDDWTTFYVTEVN
jgi:hypothetical protein